MSMSEPLLGGGKLVKLNDGLGSGLGAEGVPGAHRGMVVYSASSHLVGGQREHGAYRLTRRVIRGPDLWHVRRLGGVPSGTWARTAGEHAWRERRA
jgi:hypothetical protein